MSPQGWWLWGIAASASMDYRKIFGSDFEHLRGFARYIPVKSGQSHFSQILTMLTVVLHIFQIAYLTPG